MYKLKNKRRLRGRGMGSDEWGQTVQPSDLGTGQGLPSLVKNISKPCQANIAGKLELT